MSIISLPSGRQLSLADLTAFNDEIAALVRAGVPLDRGLGLLHGDSSGRLADISVRLQSRLQQGESLSQAVAGERASLPKLYAAVIEAGIRAGRLPAALEAMAVTVRRLDDVRRSAATAVLYPLVVLFVAYAMTVFFLEKLLPALLTTYRDWGDIGTRQAEYYAWLQRATEPLLPFLWLLPWLVLLASVVWFWQSSRAAIVEPPLAARVLGWIPWFGKLLAYSQAAAFAEVLALLVEQQTPLPEAMKLAAETTGSRAWRGAAERVAAAVSRGEPLAPALAAEKTIPPLLAWMLGGAQSTAGLAATLRHAGTNYRLKAATLAAAIRIYLPVLLTLLLGGTVTALYAFNLYAPWTAMLTDLAAAGK